MVLFMASISSGQMIEVPNTVKGGFGFISIPITKTDCTDVKFVAMDPGVSLMPAHTLKEPQKGTLAILRDFTTEARYRVLVYGAKDGKASDPAICTIVVGDPGPAPGPTPPGPGPTPGPQTELEKALQKGYADSKDKDKAEVLKRWIDYYQQSAKMIKDEKFGTWKEFFQAMGMKATEMKVRGKTIPLQEVIEKRMSDDFPVENLDKKMTTDDEMLAKNVLNEIADALKKVKPE